MEKDKLDRIIRRRMESKAMEKIFFITIFSLFPLSAVQSQNSPLMTPAEVVQAQLVAYNNRDIEAFMNVFHAEAEVFSLGEPKPLASGAEEVRKLYRDLFDQSPELHSTVINRTVLGNKVFDYEQITGRKGSKELIELVVIYEVEGSKIRRCFVVRK